MTWFNAKLKRYSHERDWEDEERSDLRKRQNLELKELYDQQTNEIIFGYDRCISPTCGYYLRDKINE